MWRFWNLKRPKKIPTKIQRLNPTLTRISL